MWHVQLLSRWSSLKGQFMEKPKVHILNNIMKLDGTQPVELKSPKTYFLGTFAGTIFMLLKSTHQHMPTVSIRRRTHASTHG